MESTTISSTSIDSTTAEQIRSYVKETHGWMKFVGIVSIVVGALYALTLVGIIVAWMPIWLGVLLTQTGTKGREYVEKATAADLADYHAKLKSFFTITGILTIVMLALMVIGIIIGIIAAIAGGLAASRYF